MGEALLTLWKEGKLNEGEIGLLRRGAEEAAIPFTPQDRLDIDTLKKTFLSMDDALGLAAPQIGIDKRIIAFRTAGLTGDDWSREEGTYEILVNPRLTQVRGEAIRETEGCLSCPELQVNVPRFPEIKVRAYDENGRKISKRYTGFLARVVQHELDHLDGRLIIDYDGDFFFSKKNESFFTKIFHGFK
jgi:peptide deformylase